MFTAITAVHVIVAITLVLVVLLQTGRGAELGAAFGGMGQATYGRGQSTFISKLTTALAVIFMTTSMTLAFMTIERPRQSLLQGAGTTAPTSAPAASPTPSQAPAAPQESQPAAPSR